MNLYQINAGIEEAMEAMLASVDPETGEVSQEAVDSLFALQMEKDQKLDNIGAYIKNLMAEVKALKDEEASLKARRESKEKQIERLKEYVASNMDSDKFESSRVVFSFRASETVDIPDESLLEERFMVQKVTASPDKKAIKEALKAGEEVRGAFLIPHRNLQIK